MISQISFSADENVSPKKPTTLTEMAKQRELSGNLADDSDSKMKKLLSDAKCKELIGHDIFGPPPEITPKSLNKHASVNISTVSCTMDVTSQAFHLSIYVYMYICLLILSFSTNFYGA